MAYITFQPKDYFNTVLYTGNGSTQSITGVGFQPDLVWNKRRTGANEHALTDAVRGTTKTLFSSLTNAETTQSGGLTSFDSDGYSVGNSGEFNDNTETYVGWNWRASGTSGSSNTDGSITSTVSANTTSGFSIVTYTGTGANATVGHGLGVAPSVYFVKRTDTTGDWLGYFKSQGAGKNLRLNTTEALDSNTTMWQNTDPTSSVFYVGSTAEANGSSNTFVAYCFAEKKGFSKFMSWSGSGSTDGTFLYTGFKPAFFMYRVTSGAGSWGMLDNKRDTINPVDNTLYAHDNSVEVSDHDVDFCSNGLKIRSAGGDINASGSSYIGMVFAEHPLVSSNDIPATAR